MASRRNVHVIDPNTRRRAQIAFELTNRGVHTEIYEDLEEFRERVPTEGAIFLADDPTACSPATLNEVLAEAGKPLPLAVYSDDPRPEAIVAAMIDGAADYLQWPFAPPLLEGALDRLATTGRRFAHEQKRKMAAKAAIRELSDREYEVLQLMMLGYSNKQIGAELGISPRTVEIHRGNMLRKLNARTPYEATRLAFWAGIDADGEEDLLAA